jgi:hypothetical protein
LEQIKNQASPLQEEDERFGLREEALGALHCCRIRAYFFQTAVFDMMLVNNLSVGQNSVRFDVLLTVHLSIILIINQLDAQDLVLCIKLVSY